ncbi:MAG: fimbria/pilus outer membrane usher protein [Hyphomonadaceae bacterium]|nr:fimbria/pilus outer membrane usher protein [Hyphomonadaceae bacterium]
MAVEQASAQSQDQAFDAPLRSSNDGADEILLLEPQLNGSDPDPAIFVVRRGEDLLLPTAYLLRNGMVFADVSQHIAGQDYVNAADIVSLVARVDETDGKLSIDCTVACFGGGSSVAASHSRAALVSPIEPGAFVNYDLYAEAGNDGTSSGAFAELGVFSDFGTGVTGLFCSRREEETTCGRLETSWTIDDPATAHRLVLGDAVTQAARWSAPARFAGVSWGTDFSLQPEFVTFPTPVMQGDSTLPSSVDVYINDALRFQSDVPAGPFRITDIPVISGEGTARTVVRDLLGREQTIVTSFYSAPELLRPGLDKYGLEAGLLRKNFGGSTDGYEDPFVAAGYSRGLSNEVTVSIRSEAGARQQSIGGSAMLANAALGQIEGALAFSGGKDGAGALGRLAQEYHSSHITVGGVVTAATPDYRVFGSDRPVARLASNMFVGLNTEAYGSASLSWAYRDERYNENFSAIGLNYAASFMGASVFATALRTNAEAGGYVASLTISIPLGGRASASSGVDYDGRRLGADMRVRSDAPVSGGIGYHARVASGGVDRAEGGITGRLPFGDVSADFSSADGDEAIRLSARGGIASVDGELIPAPAIGGGVVVVSVGQEPGVRVFHDRQLVGVTNTEGKIIVPGLRSFERNIISFDAEDLPLSVDFEGTELVVTPGYRTGHRIAFGATQSFGLMVRVFKEDGTPLPAGSTMTNTNTGEMYPVGSDGGVFIPDAGEVIQLSLRTAFDRCDAVVIAPEKRASLPVWDAGRVVCHASTMAALR